jgi:DNA-binding transcriptional MerR regulator
MLKIGDFSRICQVTIKTLRYYDQVGLLVPAEVDRFTGHCFYAYSQLIRLKKIIALKEMGLSLSQIAQLLDDDLSIEEMRGIFRLKQSELYEALQEAHVRLNRVEARINLLETGGKMPEYEVILKEVSHQNVLSIRQTLAKSEDINLLFADVAEALKGEGIQSNGAWMALYHHEGFRSENLDVEIAVPVSPTVKGTVAIDDERTLLPRRLDAHEKVASVVENGHNEQWDGSYGALGQWLDVNAYDIVLPTREVFLTTPDDPTGWLVEIQFPIKSR